MIRVAATFLTFTFLAFAVGMLAWPVTNLYEWWYVTQAPHLSIVMQIISLPAVYALILAWLLFTSFAALIALVPWTKLQTCVVKLYFTVSAAAADAIYSLLGAMTGFSLFFSVALSDYSTFILSLRNAVLAFVLQGAMSAGKLGFQPEQGKGARLAIFFIFLIAAVAGMFFAPKFFPEFSKSCESAKAETADICDATATLN